MTYSSKRTYIECRCMDKDHVLCVEYDEAEDELDFYTLLNPEWRWWKRVWLGLKYVFGRSSRWGHFDVTMLGPDEQEELYAFLRSIKKVAVHKGCASATNIGCSKCTNWLIYRQDGQKDETLRLYRIGRQGKNP